MPQKHLKELLKQDQEPFHLKNYIAERQNQLKKPPPNTQIQIQIQLKKPKPISKSKSFSCKNACFFSIHDSPDSRKSPLFDFSKKSPNRVFLNVPAKTASLLLDAAIRIQNPKTHIRNSGFGLFGSMLKRLTQRSNRAQNLNAGEKTEENRANVSLKSETGENRATVSSSCSSSSSFWYSNGRQSSLDLESSSSGRSFEEEEEGFEFTNTVSQNGVFCLSPLSPFRFSLYRSPSPEFRSSSPAKLSPCRKTEDNASYEKQSLIKKEEDEEDKEQNSPVSVLDPPFEDDEFDGHEDDDDDGYDLEGSYAFVQRAKQQLLQKLRSFEKLAELDPMELESILIEGEEDEHEYDYESFKFEEHTEVDELIDEITRINGFEHKNNCGFKRLVYDLIIEEECDEEVVVKRVCKRLESWNELESNTIDSTVGMDLRRETVNWKNNMGDQNADMAIDVEAGIFAILVEELVEDMS